VGGVLVYPGDLVVGDDNGVVVVPARRAAEIVPAVLRDLPSALSPDRSTP
jgi:regulator of RNase E activity RraA